MLTLIERGYSHDSKRHRAQLYLATYGLLAMAFLATAAKSGTGTDLFVPLYLLSLLTGCLALLLRHDWFVPQPASPRLEQRVETPRPTPREQPVEVAPPSVRLDRIASLRNDRFADRSPSSLAAAFPEFELKHHDPGQPAKGIPQKHSRPRDPFSSALTDFDSRKKQ